MRRRPRPGRGQEGVLGWVVIGPAASSMLESVLAPRAAAPQVMARRPQAPGRAHRTARDLWRPAAMPVSPRPPAPARREGGAIPPCARLGAQARPARQHRFAPLGAALRRRPNSAATTWRRRRLRSPRPYALTRRHCASTARRAHAVQGLEAGAYRYHVSEHALAPRRRSTLRGEARIAGLEQDVIGDAQAVIVVTLDVQALRASKCRAARGYRHALTEAGRLGERVYLAAGRGLAACSVGAFYDDKAALVLLSAYVGRSTSSHSVCRVEQWGPGVAGLPERAGGSSCARLRRVCPARASSRTWRIKRSNTSATRRSTPVSIAIVRPHSRAVSAGHSVRRIEPQLAAQAAHRGRQSPDSRSACSL